MRPPATGNSSTWRVVWRPRPSFSLISPVARPKFGSRALRMLDFPTPELPVKAEILPASRPRSSSMPWPVAALTDKVGMPAA